MKTSTGNFISSSSATRISKFLLFRAIVKRGTIICNFIIHAHSIVKIHYTENKINPFPRETQLNVILTSVKPSSQYALQLHVIHENLTGLDFVSE